MRVLQTGGDLQKQSRAVVEPAQVETDQAENDARHNQKDVNFSAFFMHHIIVVYFVIFWYNHKL